VDKESDDEDILYLVGQGQKMVVNRIDDAVEPKWCSRVKKRIKVHEEKMSWQMRS
jgi:hypothetical protein